MKHRDTLVRSFRSSRSGAEKRGIPWRLTLDEYVTLWAPYQHLRGSADYAMCRTGDTGDYALGNVRIDTHAQNMTDVFIGSSRCAIPRGPSLPMRVARLERRAMACALKRSEGNVTKAAVLLGITFRQMRYLVRKYG